jgi:hypothetical protein
VVDPSAAMAIGSAPNATFCGHKKAGIGRKLGRAGIKEFLPIKPFGLEVSRAFPLCSHAEAIP